MKLKKYNKATAAVLSGAIVAVVGSLLEVDVEVLAALQILITTGLVYFIPNKEVN